MINIYQLTKRYGRKSWALKSIDVTIRTGVFGLLGPNGAGKTTFMRILATLLKPSGGEAELNGRKLSHPEKIREIIGYLPQHFQIYPKLTAAEFLDYVAVMKGIKEHQRRKREVELRLEQVNLTSAAGKKVGTFSGGMKQRLGIAQAILGDPEILIVDEPTAGLDPEERVRLRTLFSQIGMDRMIIFSTHIVSDIENLCNQVGVLYRGELKYAGDPSQLRQFANGKVWEVEVDEDEYTELKGMILSTRRVEEGYRVKIISDAFPHPMARPLSPTVEDGYLALIGDEKDA